MTAAQDIKRPVAAAEIPTEWLVMVREIILRDGIPTRPSAPGTAIMIETKSLTENRWFPLGLPDGGCKFTTEMERDVVLQALVGKAS